MILKSKWYPDLVNNLSSTCTEVLKTAGYTEIEEHVLPGSLEIPLLREMCCLRMLPKKLMQSFALASL